MVNRYRHQTFGNNEFGWRISAALIGSAAVVVIYLLALKLFNSIFLAAISATLMALDGLNLVMCFEIAFFDIFLMFFIFTGNLFLVN
jgi:predicted membrane-bound dolichyl-phosphate-mannose-protein mannosyltransferase